MRFLTLIAVLLLVCIHSGFGQLQPFPQQQINDALKRMPGGETTLLSSSEEVRETNPGYKSAFSAIRKMEEVKSAVFRRQGHSSIQQIDTVLVGAVPHDTLILTGTYVHNGPVFIVNDGVLIIHNANVTNVGDVYVLQHGRLLADSSSLFFPQQYFYQRALIAVNNAYVKMEACSLSYGGFSHNLVVVDSASLDLNHVFFNDWTTAGLYGHPSVSLHDINLGGEYILSDHAAASFNNVNTLLLWHHFPDTAVINFSFPPGDSVYNYSFDDTQAGVAGISYQVHADSCTNVMWGLMPVNGSDVTISNSVIRSIGAWFQQGDTVTVSGLVDNSNYSSFTAPLGDRTLQLNNSSVQTWSLYLFDSSQVNISSCILGEVGAAGRSRVLSSQFFLDGTGGYFWANDTSLVIASNSSVTSNVRSEHNGIFLLGYSSLTGGIASSIGNSVLIVVQSSLPQDPVPYDKSAAWLANIAQPSSAFVNSTVQVNGSAWIDQGPGGSFMDFGSFSLYFQEQGSFSWNALVVDSMSEIRNATFADWNTNGLPPGNYFLRLILKNNLGDSVDAIKSVTLLPAILGIQDEQNKVSTSRVFPDPVEAEATVVLQMEGPAEVNVIISDETGGERKIYSRFLSEGCQSLLINAEDLPPGIYFYTILSTDCNRRGKFAVQH